MGNKASNIFREKIALVVASCALVALCFGCVFPGSDRVMSKEEFREALDLVEGGDYLQAAKILERLIPESENSRMRGRCCYVTASCYRKLGRWTQAISFYQMAVREPEFMLADLARLHIAAAYRNLDNYGAAVQWYESVLSEHPGRSSAVEARYQLGECNYTIGKYEAAIHHYVKFAEECPEDRRVREVTYKTGCAHQELERWSDAYVLYQGLLRQDMKDGIAGKAVSKIRFLLLSYPTLPVTRDDRVYYGLASYYAKNYVAAREELAKVINEVSEPDDLSAKAAYFIADSYHQERKYDKAIEQYASVAKKYPLSDYSLTSEYQIALCHRKAGRIGKSNTLLAEFIASHPESEWADDAGFQIGEYHFEGERYSEAADAYGKMISAYPQSDLLDVALWNMGLCRKKLNDSSRSAEAFQQLLDARPESQLADPARFWMGVCYEKMGKWQAAADAYRKVMDGRGWYYSDRARSRMERLIRRETISMEEASTRYERLVFDDSIQAWQAVNVPLPLHVQELQYLRVSDDVIDQIMIAIRAGEALESLFYNLSVLYEGMGDFNNSWRYAWRLSQLPGMNIESGAIPRQLCQMLYPLAFKETVFSSAKENNVDPFLVMAIMVEESHYDPKAVSSAGARGLIQVMPSTGREIAQHLKFKSYNLEMLLHPETNLKMGTWYLAGLANRLGKDVSEALAGEDVSESERSYIVKMMAIGAYNGGESRIRRWIKEFGLKDVDEFVENIPIQQTKQYIKKVINSYEVYKAIYSESSDQLYKLARVSDRQ